MHSSTYGYAVSESPPPQILSAEPTDLCGVTVGLPQESSGIRELVYPLPETTELHGDRTV